METSYLHIVPYIMVFRWRTPDKLEGLFGSVTVDPTKAYACGGLPAKPSTTAVHRGGDHACCVYVCSSFTDTTRPTRYTSADKNLNPIHPIGHSLKEAETMY